MAWYTSGGLLVVSAGGGALTNGQTFDYYIGPAGSDSNSGTAVSPWAITAINSKRATYAGKRVGLLDGTYSIGSLMINNDGYTPGLNMNSAGGSSISSTVIQAVNQGQAVLDAQSPSNNCPIIGTIDTSTQFITIDGIKFANGGSKILHFGEYVNPNGNLNLDGIVIQNCESTGQNCFNVGGGVTANNYSFIEIQGCVNAVIRNNYNHNVTGNAGPTNGDHYTAVLQWWSHNTLYEYNTFLGAGIYAKDDGNGTESNSGATIRYNYIDNTGWTNVETILDFSGGANIATGITSFFHHNVLVGTTGDLRAHNNGIYMPDPLQFYNNTIVMLNSGQSNGMIGLVVPGGLTHYNNIYYNLTASGDFGLLGWNVDGPGSNPFDYDLFFAANGNYKYEYFTSATNQARQSASPFSAWRTVMNNGEAHALNAVDPLLVNNTGTGASNYKLQGGSPAIGAGRSNGTTGGTACDMGAWGNGAPATLGSSLGPT